MDNTFENGFMCGLLLSLNKEGHSKNIKDPIFSYILEHCVPFATATIGSKYKCIYVVCDTTKFTTHYSNNHIVYLDHVNEIKNPNYVAGESRMYDKIHTSMRYCPYTYLGYYTILYRDDIPLWAGNFGRNVLSQGSQSVPVYKNTLYNYADNIEYEKERVAYRSAIKEFLPDTLSYAGDYTLKILPEPTITVPYAIETNRYFVDENGNESSSITATYDVKTSNYSAKWDTIKDPLDSSKTILDKTKRPTIYLSSEETTTNTIKVNRGIRFLSMYSSTNDRYNNMHTDLSTDELFDLDHEILKYIYETYYNILYTAKKVTWLN